MATGMHGHKVFAKFTVDEIHQIDQFSHSLTYYEGDIIFELGQPASHIYMLKEGSVYLMLPAKVADFSFPVAEIQQNEIFGLSSLLGAERFTAEGRCHSKCEVMAIEAKPFNELLKNNHLVGMDIMNEVAHIYYTRYLGIMEKLQDIVGSVSKLS